MTDIAGTEPEQRSLEHGRALWMRFVQDTRNTGEGERGALMSKYTAEMERSVSGGYIPGLVYKGFRNAEENYLSMRERLS
jgi:hypothetical protein